MRSTNKIPGAAVVWIGSYVFFLSTLVNNFSASHDSIHYLLDILNGREVFHQHHLLYNFLAAKWRIVLPCIPAHYAIESFTALWGSSVLTMAYLFLRRRFFLPQAESVLGMAVIAFSYGVWFYSTNIEVYMPPLFFILLCLYFLTSATITIATFRWVALFNSLAILFHQINVLFIVVALTVLFWNRHRIAAGKALRDYAVTGIVLVGGIYFLAGWVAEGHNSFAAWVAWMEGYSVGHGYWQPLSAKTPVHVLTGFSHAFIGGHFIFQLPPVSHYLQHSFSEHGLSDEIFLSSKISSPVAWALTIGAGILVVILVAGTFHFLKSYRSLDISKRSTASILLLTVAVYSIFFCFWMPEILEFWIPQMVMVWLVLIGTSTLQRVALRTVLMTAMILMFTINFFGSVRWLQDIRNDWYFNEVSQIKGQVSSRDLVIVDNEWILKDYVRYYTPATVLATDEAGYSPGKEEEAIRSHLSAGAKVFIYRNRRFTRSY